MSSYFIIQSHYGESIEQQELNHIVKEQDRVDKELKLSHLESENKVDQFSHNVHVIYIMVFQIPETLTFDEDTASSQTKKETKANLVKQQQRKKKKGRGGGSTKGQKKKPVHKKAQPTEETQKVCTTKKALLMLL